MIYMHHTTRRTLVSSPYHHTEITNPANCVARFLLFYFGFPWLLYSSPWFLF
jgi:hypothetical protein